MHRNGFLSALLLLALAVFAVSPAMAGDTDDLQAEVAKLRQQVEALSAQQQTQLEEEIDGYLDDHSAWQAAQGDKGLEGVSLTGRFTAVSQNTAGLDPQNRAIIAGDIDLDFWMQVTENLGFFVYLTGSATQGWVNDELVEDIGADPDIAPNFPFQFPGDDMATLGAFFDGIGVDGTVPIKRGLIAVREAGIQWTVMTGSTEHNFEIGSLDTRIRFGQTAFADDENTQFINNNFDDSPAISWMTDATGRVVFGFHHWVTFGGEKQFTFNWGYFNIPGRWWDQGQFMAQFAWKGEVSGREMNARVYILYDRFFAKQLGAAVGDDDDDFQWGVTWDWLATDAIGVFVKIAGNTGDVNPVEMDFSLGAQWTNFIASRPDDTVALAFGYIKANKTVLVGIPEDTEMTFELYYKFMLEDGKLQITPHIMYVMDPGGGINWVDDSLFIIGLRIFVPF